MERFALQRARALVSGALLAALITTTGSTAWGAPVANVSAPSPKLQVETNLERQLNMPVYHWKTALQQPRGIVLALHGLVMHGMSYDVLGKNLADDGFLVYATDMRGYGRLTRDYPHEFCSQHDCKHKINYEKSSQDISKLVVHLKNQFPGLPLFIVGESLGAHMALRVAGKTQESVDGLVLSAPAIKPHLFLDSHTPIAMSEVMTLTNVRKRVNLIPYIKRYASDDKQIVDELSSDPMLRRSLSIYELLQSRAAVYKTLSFVPEIKPGIPVLIIQGKGDKCVRADAVKLLTDKLRADNTQVHMFDKFGHILIETAHIKPETMSTLLTWLNHHSDMATAAANVHSQVLARGEEQRP